jgi:hypothetical protein
MGDLLDSFTEHFVSFNQKKDNKQNYGVDAFGLDL